jgi:hypothetical protein
MDCLPMYILVLFHQWIIVFPNPIQQGMTKQTGLEITLQDCIQKVFSFNLGQVTGYPDFLVVFLSPFW